MNPRRPEQAMTDKNLQPNSNNALFAQLAAGNYLNVLRPEYAAPAATRTATALFVGGAKVAGTQLGKSATKALTAHLAQTAGPAAAKSLVGAGGKLAGRAVPVLAVVEFGVKQGLTYNALQAGEIDEAEYRRQTGGNVGSTTGGVAGAAAGAAIGTAILPGVGTAIGAVLGGLFGGMGGEGVGRKLAD
jgi:hypothetical protein